MSEDDERETESRLGGDDDRLNDVEEGRGGLPVVSGGGVVGRGGLPVVSDGGVAGGHGDVIRAGEGVKGGQADLGRVCGEAAGGCFAALAFE